MNFFNLKNIFKQKEESIYDKFDTSMIPKKQDFNFFPNRYEVWEKGRLTDSGFCNAALMARVKKMESKEILTIGFIDDRVNKELSKITEFDECRFSYDRIQFVLLPEKTNTGIFAINLLKQAIGSTRKFKEFERTEPYCCNLFLIKGIISKVTFSFSNPEKLIEFYKEDEVV